MNRKDLLDWISRVAGQPGRFAAQTATAYATAVRKVLDEERDGEFTELDLDGIVASFRRAKEGELSPRTIETYSWSFKAVVHAFVRDVGDDEVQPAPRSDLRHWEFPLRPDLAIEITLPVDLQTEEADRLSMFIRSLVRPSAG